MTTQSAHSTLWRTSDTIIGITLLVGLALHLLFPLQLFSDLSPFTHGGIGLVLVMTGISVILAGKKGLRVAGQPTAPDQPTTKIVDSGIYRYSRNPMYLGLLILLVGLGLMFNIAWWVLLSLPMLFAFKYLLILPEEEYLIENFGDKYSDYMARVRRWL